MRTTVTLDDEVAAAVEQLRRERGLGVSAAINELSRRGLMVSQERPRFVQDTYPIGITVDVSNVAEALDQLDQLDR